MNKKIFLYLILSIFLISILSAQVSYCCERMVDDGPWCQNAPPEECDPNYLSVPTSCEATSYCQLGVCINTAEGTCLSNTPKRVCDDAGGVWDSRDKEDIAQCQLGCCLIGEQAAFTTLTRCKSLSSFYGLDIDYRTDIQNEIECISLAGPDVKGACVFEEEYQRNCKLTTRSECQAMNTEEVPADFYEGYLCSADTLETECGPSRQTTCVEGSDEVYYLDTCGNLANVYDSRYSPNPANLNKPEDYQIFWSEIRAPTCGDGERNADSATCGDCDYFLGSTCKKAERGNNPTDGNYICKDLSCEYEGEHYEHGETWCDTLGGNTGVTGNEFEYFGKEGNNPGDRDFRLICYNNEVTVEPCADFRQEVCVESEINGFSTAACRTNMWEDCYLQDNKKDCENIDNRDCRWIEGVSILRDENDVGLVLNQNDELVSVSDNEDFRIEDDNLVEASCVPKYSPGFNFWEDDGETTDACSRASTICYIEYAADIGEGGLKGERGKPLDAICMENCRQECYKDSLVKELTEELINTCSRQCEDDCPSQCVNDDSDYTINEEWVEDRNNVCMALGDCGGGVNYINEYGYYNVEEYDAFISRSSEEEE